MELLWTTEALEHIAHRGITLAHIAEALADPYLLLIDPDYAKHEHGTGVRQIGQCRSLNVLVVIGYEQDRDYYGATAWRTSQGKKDYRPYWEHRETLGG